MAAKSECFAAPNRREILPREKFTDLGINIWGRDPGSELIGGEGVIRTPVTLPGELDFELLYSSALSTKTHRNQQQICSAYPPLSALFRSCLRMILGQFSDKTHTVCGDRVTPYHHCFTFAQLKPSPHDNRARMRFVALRVANRKPWLMRNTTPTRISSFPEWTLTNLPPTHQIKPKDTKRCYGFDRREL